MVQMSILSTMTIRTAMQTTMTVGMMTIDEAGMERTMIRMERR
jgi:hypothetical protein